jgi:hypothetical protein
MVVFGYLFSGLTARRTPPIILLPGRKRGRIYFP